MSQIDKSTLTSRSRRLSALTIEEYEKDFRTTASTLELVERIFYSGMSCHELRRALWPYIFGLVPERCKFVLINGTYVCEEPIANIDRWNELERQYKIYRSQWELIQHDQELRFASFRERKALIERDVVRSDRSHPFYADNLNHLQSLSDLLMTYMMYDFDIGYLQGMSDIAAPILCLYGGNLVRAFWVFVEVMKLFRRNFESSQKTIHFQLTCLYRLIKLTDPKFARYLYENECANCFFTFRCVVCKFKREIMRGPGNQQDYDLVLLLWDSIWAVQRRHELLGKSKFIHTFTVAANDKPKSNRKCYSSNRQNGLTTTKRNGIISNSSNGLSPSTNTRNGPTSIPATNGFSSSNHIRNGLKSISSYALSNNHNRNGITSNSSNGVSPNHNRLGQQLTNGRPILKSLQLSKRSPQSNGYRNQHRQQNHHALAGISPLSLSPNWWANCQNNTNGNSNNIMYDNEFPEPVVKQEQIIYTKENHDSSFDPNQADVPRFELTETEKFIISLCLSLIRRERNYILDHQLDSSEIHQHFHNPQLAGQLDQLVENAYHIYHFLNSDCDIQLVLKEPNDLCLALDDILGDVDDHKTKTRTNGLDIDTNRSVSGSTADTIDLLRDYLVISPASNIGDPQPRGNVSMRSWDEFLNEAHDVDS